MASVTHPAELNSGTLTSWLPITTAWPSNSECATAIYSQLGLRGVAIAYDPFYGLSIDPSLTCHPQAVTSWWNQGETNGGDSLQIKSLGPFQCNGDYTTAFTSKVNDQTTFVACCPSNYDIQFTTASELTTALELTRAFGQLGQCNSPLTSGQRLTYQRILNGNNNQFQLDTTIIQSGASVFAVHVNGFVFADSRSASPTKNSGSDEGSKSQEATSIGTTLATSTSTSQSSIPNSSSSPTGLSSGVKAGIAVGVVLGVLGCIALVFAFFYIRRHRQRAASNPPTANSSTTPPSNPQREWGARSEVGLAQHERVFEMDGAAPGMVRQSITYK